MIYGETTRERQANAENFRRMVNHESNRVYPWIDKKFIKRSFKKCKHINTQTAQKYSATVMKFADWCRDKFPSPRDPGIFDIQNERDVAMMMILLKVARDVSGESKRDNLVDIAGYAACAAECKA